MESGLANATEDKKHEDIANWISPVAANEDNLKFLFNASIITTYGQNNSFEDLDELLYDVPTSLIVLLSCFYGTISVLAVIGNFLVMWIVATSRRMQNVINCYIANLALADIVIGLFAIPFQFQAALLQRWNLPWFMCAFCPFIQALSVNVSVFTLTAIAVDRHSAILNPLSARSSKRVAKIIITCIWLVSVILATPMAIAWRVEMVTDYTATEVEYTKPFCVTANMSNESMTIYRTCLFFLQYLSPLCIISYAYARMAFKLWATKVPGNAQGTRDATIMKNKKKVIKMLVIVVSLFGICWLPLQTYQVLQTFFPSINGYRYINIVFFCFDWLAMSNSCYNPFIYGIYNEKFKREFRERFPFLPSAWKSSNQSDVYNTDKSQRDYFPTRFSSLRSSGEGRYSTRMSIGPPNANNASFISRKRSRQSMYHYKTNDRSDDESLSVSNERNSKIEPDSCTEPILRCPYSETRSMPRIAKSSNGHSRTLPLIKYTEGLKVPNEDNSDKKRCKVRKSDCYCDSSKYHDEKHTELYILQNSNIIDFKDDKLTENNVSKRFIEHKL